MIVPANKLLLWVAVVVLPFELLSAAEPAAGTQGNFVGLEVDRTVASIAGAASIGSSRGAATIRPAPPKSVALVWGVLCG